MTFAAVTEVRVHRQMTLDSELKNGFNVKEVTAADSIFKKLGTITCVRIRGSDLADTPIRIVTHNIFPFLSPWPVQHIHFSL